MHLFYQSEIHAGENELNPEEARHALKVMRLQTGDGLHLTDGKGHFYEAKITRTDKRSCFFEVHQKETVTPHVGMRHLAIAPTKNIDRTEWLVEKAVEFGIDRISFVLCQHSERKVLKLDRIEKKAISAIKQSLKAWLPQLDAPVSLIDFLNNEACPNKFIAYVDFTQSLSLQDALQPGADHLVLIGPEGDFSSEELQKAMHQGFKQVSLGQSRLRTETAGLAAVHILNLFG